MSGGDGLDAREATAALRQRSSKRLREGFERLMRAEAMSKGWDPRDTMISLTPFIDCARRLDVDPAVALGPLAASGPAWFRETFDAFVQRTDVTLAAFGWSLVHTADGPAYRFAWPPDPPARTPRPPELPPGDRAPPGGG
jgi:hypothetical protein